MLPLALAQFVASYAASNMNVAISTIADDIGTTVVGMQTTITLFTLTMAALMIPGSKLTDIWGRKTCLLIGLVVYGCGALLAAFAQGLALMIIGYSLLEGIGSALMIPPIYILITVAFTDTGSRAKYFGVVSGAAGLGAAAGPLIGGLLTSAISWRASFGLQVLIVATIIVMARRITDPPRTEAAPQFDLLGAILSALGLFFVVLGILQSSTYGWFSSRKDFTIGDTVVIPEGGISPVWIFVGNRRGDPGLVLPAPAVARAQGRGPAHRDAAVPQQDVEPRPRDTAVPVVDPARHVLRDLGVRAAGAGIQRDSDRSHPLAGHRWHPRVVGRRWPARPSAYPDLVDPGRIHHDHSRYRCCCMALVREDSSIWTFVPGLLLIGAGVGVMLTSSVNVVQSAFPEQDQGEISGLSRSVSNLGSSLGVALAGSIIAAASVPGGHPFALSLTVMLVISVIGMGIAFLLPNRQPAPKEGAS